MADRTSAYLFSLFFEYLAKKPDSRAKRFARELWKEAGNYDFDDRQMECDKALIKLGLARRGVDPDYPDDGVVVIYDR